MNSIHLVPNLYWESVTHAIAQVANHAKQGLCIHASQGEVPLKLCVRPAVEDSNCCTRHKEDCPK